jgi:hypothetical protein
MSFSISIIQLLFYTRVESLGGVLSMYGLEWDGYRRGIILSSTGCKKKSRSCGFPSHVANAPSDHTDDDLDLLFVSTRISETPAAAPKRLGVAR